MRARRVSAVASFGSVAMIALGALAAPPASPSLSAAASRQSAREAIARVAMSLAMRDVPKVEGVYAAFDGSPGDLLALAACDDDGDPVVVLSDALLALVDFVAQAEAIDDAFGTHKVAEYAAFLGRTQSPNARTLPPPPGFFDAAQTNDPRVVARTPERRDAMIAALVAHEIAHVAQDDYACPHPSATREAGDTTWTRAEARAAMELASRGTYTPARVLSADATAARLLVATTNDGDPAPPNPEDAYVALITVFDRLPASAYARLHQVPGTTTAGTVRAEVVLASAARERETRAHAHQAPQREQRQQQDGGAR